MTNPKLALIPSGYKAGTNPTVYSILPNDASGDFDFSRASEGTRVRKDGLIEEVADNVPRLDWLNSNCPSLLLEPQRTNLQVRSEEFDNVSWSKANAIIDANVIISPNGELTADKLIANTTTTTHYIQGTVSGLSTSSETTFSVFVRKAEISQLQLLCAQNTSPFTNWARLSFDLNTLSDFSTTIGTFGYEDYGNGWLRIFITGTPTSTGALIRITLFKNFGDYFAGNDNDGFYLFGAQVEQGYLTSYIKTEGNIETRLKDECLNGGDSDLFDITEGTFFVDVTPYINTSSNHYISLNDGSSSDRFVFIFQSNGTQVRLFGASATVDIISHYQNITFNQRNKLAVTFKNNEFKFYVNGSLVHTAPSGNMPTGLNQLDFSEYNGNRNFEGKVHDTRVYDRVLTEAEIIKLTT